MADRIDAIAGHIPVEKDVTEEVSELQHNAKGNAESSHTNEVKEQCGFRADRSTADKIFYSRVQIEKKLQHSEALFHNVSDFKKAFDTNLARGAVARDQKVRIRQFLELCYKLFYVSGCRQYSMVFNILLERIMSYMIHYMNTTPVCP